MRYLIAILIILFSLSAKSQYVRFDSTVIHQNRLIYNNAGYYIGKDSLHTKRVRLVNCNDTIPIDNDTLIARFPQRFITMDSIVGGGGCTECGVPLGDLNDSLRNYLQRAASDTIFGVLYMRDKPGSPFPTQPGIYLESASGSYILTMDSGNGLLVSNIGDGSQSTILSNSINIARDGYTPTNPTDVLTLDETQGLISDSIANRPTLTTVRNEISDSLATVLGAVNNVKIDVQDTITADKYTRKAIYLFDPAMQKYVVIDSSGFGSVSPLGTINFGGNALDLIGLNSDELYMTSKFVKLLDRDGYTPGNTDFLRQDEIKSLINDSLDTRLTLYTPNADLGEKIEDQIGLRLVAGSNMTVSYNDGTGETTVSATGAGLSSEQVFDTLAYSIRMGEGLQKTKSDTGDSLYIELKLKNALERIVYASGSHKAVFMATNTTGGTAHWGFQITATGTVTAPTKATTNRFSFSNRWETLVTVASTSAVAGFRSNAGIAGFGNAAGMGGFYYNSVSGAATGLSNTNARYFNGLSTSTSAPTDVNPSSLTNCFGIGYDASDGNLQFMHNDGSGTCTKVDLGSNFAVTTTDRTNFYRLIMYAEDNGSVVYYKVIDMADGDTYTGSVNTNLPSNTLMFAPYGYTSVGGSSAVTGFSLMSIEMFTDY